MSPTGIINAPWRRPWLGIATVYLAAIWLRLSMPWLPLADADTWGYLNPALQDLAGNGLVQTQTRDMAYPLFLRAVLGVSGNFASIPLAQHVLGLLSGGVWLWAFGLWLAWLPLSNAGRLAGWWIAALCLAAYLCNPATLSLETQIRPESVFPLFAMGQIAAVLVMCHSRWRGDSPAMICLGAFGSALLALICISLKPSWGIAAAVPFLVAAIASFSGPALVLRVRAGILLSAACAFALWTVALPPLVRWVPEPTSGNFLAATLFTVHADIIARDMHRRDEAGELDPSESEFLKKLDTRLAESRAQKKQAYPLLGHDADYLFYRSDLLVSLPGVPPESDKSAWAGYLRGAYLRAALSDPGAIAAKVWRQLATVFGDATESVFKPSVQWRKLFIGTNESLDEAPFPGSDGLQIRESLEKVRERAAGEPSKLTASLAPPGWFLRGPVSWALAVVVILGGAVVIGVPFWRHAVPALVPGALAFAIIWCSTVGAAFTVAVVHSFDIDRYGMLLSSCNTLLIAAGLVLAGAFVRPLTACARVSRQAMAVE